MISPSAGIMSFGRTKTTSPRASFSAGTVSVPPSAVFLSASFGASFISDSMPLRDFFTVHASSISPSAMRKAISPAAKM